MPRERGSPKEILARRRNGDRAFTVQSQDDLLATFGTLTSAMTLMAASFPNPLKTAELQWDQAF